MNQTAELAVPAEGMIESFWGDSEAETALAHLVTEIALDATHTPENYLRDTIVPEGGE